MDLLTTITQCSLHHDIGLVLAIVTSFSGGNPYAVADATQFFGNDSLDSEVTNAEEDGASELSLLRRPQGPKSTVEAILAVQRIAADGGKPVLGLMPVSLEWVTSFDRKQEEAFDACVNLGIATSMLAAYERQCGTKSRRCALHKYAKALGLETLEDQVLEDLGPDIPPRVSIVNTDAVLGAPIAVESDPHRSWGADQLVIYPDFPERATPHDEHKAPPVAPAPAQARQGAKESQQP